MLYNALAVLYVLLLAFFARTAIQKDRLVAILPSAFWVLIMVLPFALQTSTFSPVHVPIHAFGLFLVGTALLLGDTLCVMARENPGEQKSDALGSARLCLWLSLAGVAIVFIHLALLPEIPLWTKYFGRTRDGFELAKLRESVSKVRPIPSVLSYAFQSFFFMVGPLVIALWVRLKKPWYAVALFAFFLLYSRAGLDKGPSYIYIASCLLGLDHALGTAPRSYFRRGMLIVCALLGLVTILALSMHPRGILRIRMSPSDVEQAFVTRYDAHHPPLPRIFTRSDHLRLFAETRPWGPIQPLWDSINSLFYRVIVAEVEVSHWWYIYFPEYHGGFLGWYGLSPRSRSDPSFQRPSNMLGRFAYSQRFPKLYPTSVNANASMDTDAYARWGKTGLIIVAILVLLVRLIIPRLAPPGFPGKVLATLAIFTLARGAPAVPIQALLVAQGLLAQMGTMLAFRIALKIKS